MKIAPQTKENFKAACLNQSAIARALEVSASTVNQVVNGTYPNLGGKDAQKVVRFLRDKKILVLEGDSEVLGEPKVAFSEVSATTTH